jgi:hypothetical protein
MASSLGMIGTGLLIASMGLVAGCAAKQEIPPPRTEAEENLQKIGQAYMDARAGLKRSPRNNSDLLPFLRKVGGSEQTLRSPRDGLEYVIHWDVKPADLLPKPVAEGVSTTQRLPVLAYERVGDGGKRFVLQVPNRIVSMTSEELNTANFPAGHSPAP